MKSFHFDFLLLLWPHVTASSLVLILIAAARDLYRDEPLGVELSETVYAFDSTTIDLCLALFPWRKFRRHKSAVKLHTLLDLRAAFQAMFM